MRWIVTDKQEIPVTNRRLLSWFKCLIWPLIQLQGQGWSTMNGAWRQQIKKKRSQISIKMFPLSVDRLDTLLQTILTSTLYFYSTFIPVSQSMLPI